LQLKIKDPFLSRCHTQQPFVSCNSHTYIGRSARPLDLIPLRLSGLEIRQNKTRPIGINLQGYCFSRIVTQYGRLSIDCGWERKRNYDVAAIEPSCFNDHSRRTGKPGPPHRERCSCDELSTIHVVPQNTNLNPNCICRGVVPCAREVILPALAAISVLLELINSCAAAGVS